MKLPDVEQLAEKAHEAWLILKRSQGLTSRKSEVGEELMVRYADLSEAAKDEYRREALGWHRAMSIAVWRTKAPL